MKLSAPRKWTVGLLGATALVLGTAGVTAATVQPEKVAINLAAQDEFAREGQPNIYTNDIDRASRFYQVLGFTELFRFTFPDGTIAFATLQKGPFYLTFANTTIIKQNTGLDQIGRSYFKPTDITVLVPNVDAVVAAARAAGARVLMAPKDQPWGERQAFVSDPDGNLVQISTHNGGH